MQDKVLEKIDDKTLTVFVVWTPVVGGDNRKAAAKASQIISDKRAVHYWDGDKKLGFRFGRVVDLPERNGSRLKLAWDVYFAFDKDAEWKDEPPKPADWMHQLSKGDRRLDGDRLREAVKKLLK